MASFVAVVNRHGYERDREKEKSLDIKGIRFYGRGSTGGADPQWRFQIIIQPNGDWTHSLGLFTSIGHGKGANNLDHHLDAFAARHVGSSATYVKKRA